MRALLIIAPAILVLACQRDPGRDVRPMADPLRTDTAASDAPVEIIPLEQVQESQAAAVSQRVANTETVVTYSRPVARGRASFGALVPYDQAWNPGADRARCRCRFACPDRVRDAFLTHARASPCRIRCGNASLRLSSAELTDRQRIPSRRTHDGNFNDMAAAWPRIRVL